LCSTVYGLGVDLEGEFDVDAELVHLTILDGGGLLVDINGTDVADAFGGAFYGVFDGVFVAVATFAEYFDDFKDFAHNEKVFVGDGVATRVYS
jgi:hypothetical protein